MVEETADLNYQPASTSYRFWLNDNNFHLNIAVRLNISGPFGMG